MIERVACPQPPQGSKPAKLVTHTLTPSESLYRIYRGDNPVQFARTAGANRFDPLPSPYEATRVLYAGSTPEVAVSETVLRWHDRVGSGSNIILAPSQVAERKLVALHVDRPLLILDFSGFGMKPLTELVTEGIAEGIFLCDRAGYRLTQAWAAWFRAAYPDAAGLRWMSRHHNSSHCYVFFDTPCRDALFLPQGIPIPLTPGTPAHAMLKACSDQLGWELDDEPA